MGVSISLKREFFESDVWAAGTRSFSRQEALLDLLGVVATSKVSEDAISQFSGRWRWDPDRVEALLRSTRKSGWVDVDPWRVLNPPGVEPPPPGDPTLVRSLHGIYNEMLDRNLKLTQKRRQKYRALLEEHLLKREDPELVFRRICRAVMASEFHMEKRAYHDPASLFRNEERRERWVLDAERGDHASTEEKIKAASELASEPDMSGDRELPNDEDELKEWFDVLPEDRQKAIRDTWNRSASRFRHMDMGKDPEYRKALWLETVRAAKAKSD